MTLTDHAGQGAAMVLAVPIQGQAQDIFGAVTTLVVFLDPARGWEPDERALVLLRQAVGLTGREVEVTRLVTSGVAPRGAAARMGIGFGTVRLHLKSVFAKAGVHSQAELTALVRRLG